MSSPPEADGEAQGQDDDGEQGDTAEKDEGSPATQSTTILVVQESESRSVWAYEVQHKGASETWVIEQIVEDLDTIGLRNDRIVIKSDQEPSATEV